MQKNYICIYKIKKNYMNKISTFLLSIFALGGITGIFIFAKKSFEDDQKYNELRDSTYSVYALPIPDSVTFAGEKVPLENFDVREALDKELHKITYWQSESLLYFKRANRYFPTIEKILKEKGMPDDFKYLAVAESGLTNVISPAKATGFWQFLKSTGKSYGLEINNEVDERYHLEKSTIAACKFLKKINKKYKNWAMTAAAYNMGQSNLDKQIKKQKNDNYYDLLLNAETSRYVFRIIAFKLIMSNPEHFGFKFRHKDLYPQIPVYKIELDTAVTDFAIFAQNIGINYKMLKTFNPWLRENFLTNKNKKTYYLKIPKENSRNKKYFK